jgi:hypothetical protein
MTDIETPIAHRAGNFEQAFGKRSASNTSSRLVLTGKTLGKLLL